MAIALADLLTVVTADDVMAEELSVAAGLGLPTTSWQPIGITRTILQTNAVIVADTSADIYSIAAGGFATTAAQLPTFGWMDLVSQEVYAVTRIPAQFASLDDTEFSVTNSSGSNYGPFAPGQFIVSNPTTGATYQNTDTITIGASATTGVAVVAQVAGQASTSGPGTITNIVTPLVGCTCTNTGSAIGSDAETNAQLLKRDQAKLGALSPNGPAQAYYFVATSILDPLQPFYNAALTEPITRVATISSPARVDVYIANASGPPSGPDVAIVDAAIQQWAVPLGITATVQAAGAATVNVTETVYVPSTAGVDATQLETDIAAALAIYFSNLPIGGVTGAVAHIVPVSQIISVTDAVNPAIADVEVAFPAADVVVGATEVPVLGAVNVTVVVTT